MAFSEEQIKEIKEQLIEQVNKLDNPNKEGIIKFIVNLDEQGLEDFLKKNNIKVNEKDGALEQATPEDDSKEGGGSTEQKSSEPRECIFCNIIKGNVPSYNLGENSKSVAILEINPLSKGHSIVLPKDHVSSDRLPKTSMSLAQKLAKRIKKKLKADDIKLETSNFQGHSFINVVPIYKDVPLKKIKAEEKDLKILQQKLEQKTRMKRKEVIKQKVEKIEDDIPRISFRVP